MKRFLALALLLAAPAYAETAERLYADGKYDESIKTALAENDAAGFATAARSELAEEASRERPCLDCLERAESYARRAIAADPKLPDGQIYLAITLGLEGRIRGALVAKLNGYPGEAKEALDAALKSDPKNPWALAGLGGWNIEIVNHAGRVLGKLLYDASVEKGQALFQAAFKAAPDNISVRYQYALSLAGCDAETYRAEIVEALKATVNGSVDTVYGHLLQKHAGELLNLLDKDDRSAFDARVRKYDGYP